MQLFPYILPLHQKTTTKAMNQTGITSANALSELGGQDRGLDARDLSARSRRLLSDEEHSRRADSPRFRSMMRTSEAV